jgi:hypothetical protein
LLWLWSHDFGCQTLTRNKKHGHEILVPFGPFRPNQALSFLPILLVRNDKGEPSEDARKDKEPITDITHTTSLSSTG